MPVKKILVALSLLLLSLSVWSQGSTEPKTKQEKKSARREKINQMIRQEEEGEVVFHKQSVFGFKMSSDGYGFSYELGKYKTNRKTILYQFEFNEKKHPKEKKISLFDGFGFSNIVFGKMNNFYQAKLGLAQQTRIGGKGNKNGVAVSGILGGGLSIGLMKPYLVDVNINGSEAQSTFPTIIDSSYAINGASGFLKGWGDVKINPGAHVKMAMRFDYGRFNESVTAIEVGLMGEYYAQKVPQLAYVDQKNFFFNAYISILFGRRK
jgi:hypothetical protein